MFESKGTFEAHREEGSQLAAYKAGYDEFEVIEDKSISGENEI